MLEEAVLLLIKLMLGQWERGAVAFKMHTIKEMKLLSARVRAAVLEQAEGERSILWLENAQWKEGHSGSLYFAECHWYIWKHLSSPFTQTPVCLLWPGKGHAFPTIPLLSNETAHGQVQTLLVSLPLNYVFSGIMSVCRWVLRVWIVCRLIFVSPTDTN